jgi:hypothetical protein
MTAQALAIGNELLRIHQEMCRSGQDRTSVDGRTIRYKSLFDRAGVPFSRDCGPPLAEIAEWCADSGYPPFHALVVNQSGEPGFNYDGSAGGCRLDNWCNEVR